MEGISEVSKVAEALWKIPTMPGDQKNIYEVRAGGAKVRVAEIYRRTFGEQLFLLRVVKRGEIVADLAFATRADSNSAFREWDRELSKDVEAAKKQR